jgi:hypothetical protein
MESPFDIFRVEDGGSLLWKGSAASMDEAKARVREFAQSWPAEYLVINLQSGLKLSIAATGVNTPNDAQSQTAAAPEG